MPQSKINIALVLSHCCLALCMSFLSYSAKNYFAHNRVVVPSVVALSPTSRDKVDLFIADLLPNTKDGTAAKKMLSHRIEEMQRLHESWLFHMKLQESFALYQTISWAVAAIISLCAVLVLHRIKRHARQSRAPADLL